MVVDISFPFEYAEDGDIEIVNGRDFYEQHALLVALSAQPTLRGTPLTANQVTEIEGTLTNAFRSSPFLTDPTVSVTSTTDTEITLRVDIAEVDPFEIPVTTDT